MTLKRPTQRRCLGWSTVDLAASVTILVVGILSLAAGFHDSARLSEKTRENYLFKQALSAKVAELEASTLGDLPSRCGPGVGERELLLRG